MNQLGWTELPVKSIDRAKKFYEGLLNTKLPIEFIGNVKVLMLRDENQTPYICIFEVSDFNPDFFAITLSKKNKYILTNRLLDIQSLGGEVISRVDDQNLSGSYSALIQDSEGNRLALFNSP